MKKFKIIIAGLIIAIGITISCDESGLDLVNPNEFATDTFLKSSIQLESAVTACYAFLQGTGNYARYQYYLNDNIAGENYAVGNLEADKVQMLARSVDAANYGNNLFWKQNYLGIGRCNFVIGNEAQIENIGAVEKASRLGEARFLRGLFYFHLVIAYGEIPLVLDLEIVEGGKSKSSVADVYAAIVADLDFAATNLLAKGDQEQGRPTSKAAWALLGRVYLQMGGHATEAKAALANVTGYSLVDNFTDNFTVAGEHNAESIYEVHYDASTGQGDSWNQDGLGNSETSFRAAEYSGFYNVKPSQILLDEFEDGDTRFSDTFYSIDVSNNGTMTNTYNNGANFFIANADDTDPNDNLTPMGSDDNPSWRKYQNLDNMASEIPNSGINARVIRYADVLLMKAEAEIRSGGLEAVALGYLNEVRQRPSVNMPDVAVTGTQAILDAIMHERWVELAGEQSRWKDLQRFQGDTYSLPIPNNELDSNTNL